MSMLIGNPVRLTMLVAMTVALFGPGQQQVVARHGETGGHGHDGSSGTSFTVGQVTLQSGSPADLSGDYTLPGPDGTSVQLTLVQDDSGNVVGTATVTAADQSFGPFDIQGGLRSCRTARFWLRGEFEQDLGLCDDSDDDEGDDNKPGKPSKSSRHGSHDGDSGDDDDDDNDDDQDECDDELEIKLRIGGYQSGSAFNVFVSVRADGMDELEARFRGTITPAASEDATTSTYVISDAPSVLNGCKIESEREVSKDGASLGTAQTRQYGYSSRVRYCAYLQSDSGEKFRFRLYGSAEEGSAFKVFGARLYTTGGKVYIPAESVSVEASAFVPEQEPDDSDDDE